MTKPTAAGGQKRARKATEAAGSRKAASRVGKQTTRDRRTAQPKYAAAAALRSQILELRTLGRTLSEISQAVGRSISVVHTHLTNALRELDEEQHEQASRYRALSYNRLERLLAKAMLKGAGGDLKAMREAHRLIMAQARIMGFEAPIKHASTDPSGEHERLPPGTWTLPATPSVSIEDWQRQAEAIWHKQEQLAAKRAHDDAADD